MWKYSKTRQKSVSADIESTKNENVKKKKEFDLHKYEKYLKIILQLFKKDLIYRYFNLKKKHRKYLLPFITPSTLAIALFALHNLFRNILHAITIEINPTLTGSYKTESTQFQWAEDIRKSGVERLWEASK